jgi:hypothetical protein
MKTTARTATSVVLLLVVTLVFSGSAAVAQPSGPTQDKPAAVEVRPAGASAQSQSNVPPVAGRPAEAPRGPQPPSAVAPGQPLVADKKAIGVPEPTVVLKPGEVPAVKFDQPNYDFGRIPAGTSVNHSFWFTNTGNGPLEILKVQPACGCTVAGAYDRIVPPGESGKIPLVLNTGKTSGKASKSITVFTNIPGTGGTTPLQISGETWLPLEANPANASFGRLTREQAAKGDVRKVTLVNNVPTPANPTDIRCSNSAFTALVTVLEPGRKFELTVTLAPQEKPGSVSGTIDFSTGLTESPTMQLPVNAFIAPDLEVSPDRFFLPGGRTAPMTREFFVRNNASQPLKVTEVSVTNPALKTNLQEMQPGTQYRITVEVPADFNAPPTGEKITFKTDSTTTPQGEIPIIGQPAQPAQPAQPTAAAVSATPVTAGPGAPPAAGTGATAPPAAGIGVTPQPAPAAQIRPAGSQSPAPAQPGR